MKINDYFNLGNNLGRNGKRCGWEWWKRMASPLTNLWFKLYNFNRWLMD